MSPLQITIEQADGRYLAHVAALSAYGIGDTPEQALADFRSMAQDLLTELENSEAQLNAALRQQLASLRAMMGQ